MPFILYEAAVCVMNQGPPTHCRTMTHGLSLSCYFIIFFLFLTSTFININIFLIFHPGHLFFNYPPSHSQHCYLVSPATTFLKLPMFSNKLPEKSITYSVHILPEGRWSLLSVFLRFHSFMSDLTHFQDFNQFLCEWNVQILVTALTVLQLSSNILPLGTPKMVPLIYHFQNCSLTLEILALAIMISPFNHSPKLKISES